MTDEQWVVTGYKWLPEKDRRILCESRGAKGNLELYQGVRAVLIECIGKGISQSGYDILGQVNYGVLGTTKIGIKDIVEDTGEIVKEIPRLCVQIVLPTEEVVDRVTRIQPYLKEGFEWREEAGGVYSPTIDSMLHYMHTGIFKMCDSSAKRFHHKGLLQLQSWVLTEVQNVAGNPDIKKQDLETTIGNPAEFYRKIVGWNITAEEICKVLALTKPPTIITEEQPTGTQKVMTLFSKCEKLFMHD